MKTSVRILLLVLLCSLNGYAADYYRFGFCDNTKALSDQMLQLNGSKTVEGAVRFTAADMARFVADGTIDGINLGMANKFNVSSVRVWLRESLSGAEIASFDITDDSDPALGTGWLSAIFDQPVKVEAGRDYYAGYTMTAKNGSMVLVCFDNGSHPESCWLKVGDGEWTDHSADMGILNLELLMTSSTLPQNDVTLTGASCVDNYIVPGQGVAVEYSLRNIGMNPVTGYTLTLADEAAGISATRQVTCDLAHDARVTLTETFDVEGLQPEHNYNFTLTLSKPNGIDDETPADNVWTLPEITAIGQTFLRTVLIEEFTTQKCGNCPAAAKNLHSMYDTLTAAQQARTAIVCHHSGFYTDEFTKPCDEQFLFFYGSGGMFAPAFMFDRVKQAERGVPVVGPQSALGLKNYFLREYDREAFYSIQATGNHDEASRTIDLDIAGKVASRVFNNPRITVYLTEDNIADNKQSNGGGNYIQNHVIRAYSSTWGDAPEWSDDFNYTKKVKLTYPAGCNLDNMELIAVIANYNSGDCNDCEVGNAFKVSLRDLKKTEDPGPGPGDDPSGVDNVDSDIPRIYVCDGRIISTSACKAVMVYDMSGRRCENRNLGAGIYVARVVAADGTATTHKVMVP